MLKDIDIQNVWNMFYTEGNTSCSTKGNWLLYPWMYKYGDS